MQTFTDLVLAIVSLQAVTRLASAAPQEVYPPAKPLCVVPEIAFFTLAKPFTLTALIDEKSSAKQKQWPVQLTPRVPTARDPSRPVLSNTRIAQPEFKLVQGELVYQGVAANFQPSIAIFPPPLQSFVWHADGGKTPAKFTAGYGCDEEGNRIIRLIGKGASFSVSLPLF